MQKINLYNTRNLSCLTNKRENGTPDQEKALEIFDVIWSGLAKPLLRLLVTMSAGILIANTLEALSWERFMARLAAPLVRLAHMGEAAGASFVMAFFSVHSASTILTNAYADGRMSKKELMLSNIFNSMPSYLVHLPSVAAVAIAFMGRWGVLYIALGFSAAVLRTLGTAAAGHILLPAQPKEEGKMPPPRKRTRKEILDKILGTFQKRLIKVLKFTIPIYIIFFHIQYLGGFKAISDFMTEHVSMLSFLKPEAMGIVALSLATETSASMSAGAALLHSGALGGADIVIAMLVGNILSSPVRAFRHQLPIYAGYFPAGIASLLVVCNQLVRTASLILVLAAYYCLQS